MKKLSLHQKFELKTYSIPVKDEWIQFSAGTPEMDILESILQENKKEGIVLTLLQRMGVSVAEKKAFEGESTKYANDAVAFFRKIVDVSKKDNVDESVVRKAMINEPIFVDKDGKVTEGETGLATKLDYQLKENDKETLNELATNYVQSQNGYLDAMTVLFINTRIVDVDTKKSIKNSYSVEQLTNLSSDFLDAVKEFVSYELFGYPDDEQKEDV
jgi:hypothetical protein